MRVLMATGGAPHSEAALRFGERWSKYRSFQRNGPGCGIRLTGIS